MTFDDILKDSINGCTKKQIAEKHYYSPHTVRNKIKERMSISEFNDMVDTSQRELYVKLSTSGATDKIIMSKMNMSHQTLINKKRKWGLL